MLRLILHRLAISVVVVAVVTGLSFILLSLLPGTAATVILGTNATTQQIAALNESLGLDKPFYEQYWRWLSGIAHGNLGTSLLNQESVAQALNQRLGVSLTLLAGALVIAVIVGGSIGIWSAARPGILSQILDLLAIGGLAVPGFWLALILVLVFSVNLQLLPPLGYVAPTESLTESVRFLILPWITLALTMTTSIAKQTRDGMAEALASPYVTSLYANGVPERSVILKHALRNAAIPVVTLIGLLFVSTLTSAVIAESIFLLPGLGSAIVKGTAVRDIPMIQGVALYVTVIVVVVNLLVDLAYGWLNPKVRTT